MSVLNRSHLHHRCRMRWLFPLVWRPCNGRCTNQSSVSAKPSHCRYCFYWYVIGSLGQNIELLRTLSAASSGAKVNTNIKRTNLNNILMQLRKYVWLQQCCTTKWTLSAVVLSRCLQHPYLVSQEIEPKGLAPLQAHEKLIDGSAKLRMLKSLLPKLQARGHRVLLFSQVSIPNHLQHISSIWNLYTQSSLLL